MSVDDNVTEMQATFVARLVEPWGKPLKRLPYQPFYGV